MLKVIKLKILSIMYILIFFNINGQNVINEKFEKLMITLNNLETNGKYDEALKIARNEFTNFREKEFELIKEIEYLNTKLKRYEDNLILWKEAHSKGYFFLLNTGLKQYKPYLQFEEFKSLTETDRNLRECTLNKSKTKFHLLNPIDYSEEKTYPLLIILHGGGSNIEKAERRWEIIPDLMDNYFIVFVQSYRNYDFNTYGWSSTDKRGYDELIDILKKIITENPIDTGNIILSGTSAGATFSLGLLTKQTIPITGLIAFCPGKPESFKISERYAHHLKVFMAAGENDYYLPKQKLLVDYFTNKNIKYKYKIIMRMGHEFPKTYQAEMREALEFIQTN